MVETIRQIYRSTYIVATLKRDDLFREGREDEIDRIVEAVRNSQMWLAEASSKSSN